MIAALRLCLLSVLVVVLSGTIVRAQSCLPNQIECGGACFDPQTSTLHCGACDNRCFVDEACTAGRCLLLDTDGDQWSDPEESTGVGACSPTNAQFNPGVRERCNSVDDNCNGQNDEPGPHSLCPAQIDSVCQSRICNAGFGCAVTFAPPGTACGSGGSVCDGSGTCVLQVGAIPIPRDFDNDGVTPPLDCDDALSEIRPGFAEVCDGFDNDCNAAIDDGVSCDDGNVCTTDSCRGAAGCRNRVRFDGTPCGPDSICLAAVCTAITVFVSGFEGQAP